MAKGRKYALLIGNSSFADHRLSRLLAPNEDVRALRELLRDPDIGGFDDVDEVINGTLDGVRPAVSRLFKDKGPDDLVLLYYSGHGLLDLGNRLYLATAASDLDDPAVHSLEASYVKDRMDDCRSQRQVLILDCCHSGAFGKGQKRGKAKAVTSDTFAPQGRGRFTMTASDAQQFAWEGQTLSEGDEEIATQNSVFTHYLVEGLTSADVSNEETITVQQWYDYAHRRVVAANPNMTPQHFVEAGAGQLQIARSPSPALSEEVREALVSDDPYRRLGAVAELKQLLGGDDARLAAAANKALQARFDDETYVHVHNAIREALTSDDTTETLELRKTVSDLGQKLERAESAAQEAQRAESTALKANEEASAWVLRAIRKAKRTTQFVVMAALVGMAVAGSGVWFWQSTERDAALRRLVFVEAELGQSKERVKSAEDRLAQRARDLARIKLTLTAAETEAEGLAEKISKLTADRDDLLELKRELDRQLAGAAKERDRLREASAASQKNAKLLSDTQAQLSATKMRLKAANERIAALQQVAGRSITDCSECPVMVVVPAGSFTMGSPDSEQERSSNEGPQHQVTISRPFAVGIYEVTFDQWPPA